MAAPITLIPTAASPSKALVVGCAAGTLLFWIWGLWVDPAEFFFVHAGTDPSVVDPFEVDHSDGFRQAARAARLEENRALLSGKATTVLKGELENL